jgi:hypothetical protein
LQFQLDVQRLQLEEVSKKYAAELDWKERAQRDWESTTQKAGDVSVRCQSYSEQNAALRGQLSIAEQSVANLEKVGGVDRGFDSCAGDVGTDRSQVAASDISCLGLRMPTFFFAFIPPC